VRALVEVRPDWSAATYATVSVVAVHPYRRRDNWQAPPLMSSPSCKFVGAVMVSDEERLCSYRRSALALPLVIRRRCSAISRKTSIHTGCGPTPKAFRYEIQLSIGISKVPSPFRES
jgi:hypothetical protein